MQKILSVLKALSDRGRLRVVMVLGSHGELCVCRLTEMLAISMPSVSRHMSILQNARLVKSRKDGRWVYYRLSDEFPRRLMICLKESLASSPELAQDIEKIRRAEFCPSGEEPKEKQIRQKVKRCPPKKR